MLTYSLLIFFYSAVTALSIYYLGHLRLFVDKLNLNNLFIAVFNFPFWLGLFFALLARLTFIVINSQLSTSPTTHNANTTITFVVTLSSVIAVVVLNFVLLHEKLTLNQIIGATIVVLGIVWMVR